VTSFTALGVQDFCKFTPSSINAPASCSNAATASSSTYYAASTTTGAA